MKKPYKPFDLSQITAQFLGRKVRAEASLIPTWTSLHCTTAAST